MVKGDGVHGVEVVEIVLVRRIVTMPRDHLISKKPLSENIHEDVRGQHGDRTLKGEWFFLAAKS